LYLKAEKCRFDIQEVEFLGLSMKPDQLTMDPTKLASIREWPALTMVKGVRSFLGFGNFYRQFIGHFAKLARPLNELTWKNKTFEWTAECQQSFKVLKAKFSEAPILLIPDPTKPFIVKSDASKFATGAVLRQQDMNRDWHPCGYISHSFNAMQRNYKIYDCELLGIICALETWRHYLLGSQHLVTIFSNHKNLMYFRTAQKLNHWQAQWSLLLSQFDLKLVHVLGFQMVQSDALSRQPDMAPEEDNDNANLTLLPDTLFVKVIDTDLKDAFLEAFTKNNSMHKTVETINRSGTPLIRSTAANWKIKDGLVFYKGRCFIPENFDI